MTTTSHYYGNLKYGLVNRLTIDSQALAFSYGLANRLTIDYQAMAFSYGLHSYKQYVFMKLMGESEANRRLNDECHWLYRRKYNMEGT